MMNNYKEEFSKSTSFFIDLIGIIVIFIVLRELQGIFIPLVIAYFLFFVFSPINNFFIKIKTPIFLVVILDLLIIILFLGSISSVIVDSFSRFGNQLPFYESKLNNLISHTAISVGIADPQFSNFEIGKLLSQINYKLIVGDVFTSTFSLMGSLFFIIFFFIFVMTGHKNIYNSIRKRYIKVYLDNNIHTFNVTENTDENENTAANTRKEIENIGEGKLSSTFQEIIDQVQKYLITKFIMSLVMGITVGIIIFISGVDFPVVWIVITFLFHFIPNVGSFIAVLLPSLMALVQYESIGFAIFLALLLIAVQNIIGNIVEPKIFGHRLGLNPIIVLLSLLLWGYIWGITGMILSVPLTSVVKIIISQSDSPNMKFINDIMS